jgi:hypothetical protein
MVRELSILAVVLFAPGCATLNAAGVSASVPRTANVENRGKEPICTIGAVVPGGALAKESTQSVVLSAPIKAGQTAQVSLPVYVNTTRRFRFFACSLQQLSEQTVADGPEPIRVTIP